MPPTLEPTRVPRNYPRAPHISQERSTDPETGRPVITHLANVQLRGGKTAVFLLEDFNRLMRDGFSDQMFLRHNGTGWAYVQTRHPSDPDQMFTAARVLTGAPPHTRVRYRDHNPLNLRPDNLVVVAPEPPKAEAVF